MNDLDLCLEIVSRKPSLR